MCCTNTKYKVNTGSSPKKFNINIGCSQKKIQHEHWMLTKKNSTWTLDVQKNSTWKKNQDSRLNTTPNLAIGLGVYQKKINY